MDEVGLSGLEEAKRAWATHFAGLSQEEIDQRVLGFSALVEGIARSGAISPEEFASKLGIEPSRAKDIFAEFASMGVQIDEQGNAVAAALTARQTAHRIQVGGRELYAWCALDTLFIPGLVGEPADIESTCPTSGEAIRLRVSPDGACDYEPGGAVLSVLLPGASGLQVGPASPT